MTNTTTARPILTPTPTHTIITPVNTNHDQYQSNNMVTNEYCDTTIRFNMDPNSNSIYLEDEVLKSKYGMKIGDVFYSHDIKDTHLHLNRYMQVNNILLKKEKNVAIIRQCSDLYLLYGQGACTIVYSALKNIACDEELIM